MQLEITPTRYGIRQSVQLPDPDILLHLKEEGVRKLISDHYDLLVQSEIKDLFPANPVALEKAKNNSADFFVQVMGGPDYFNRHRGQPRLVARHARFRITGRGREVWLECYQKLIPQLDLPDHLKLSFWKYLDVFSNWMVNTP
ncbi:MAG: hypothetical protein RBS73_04755 [Prolixibacteraceae bacterium]|jgi:hemoglobin|nr:hypothetical protein [Prolixibacteraceae bacterium]